MTTQTALTAIHCAALNLVTEAQRCGVVVTIDTTPRPPLAMGNYWMQASVRPARTPPPYADSYAGALSRELLGIVRTAQSQYKRLLQAAETASEQAQTKRDLSDSLEVIEHAVQNSLLSLTTPDSVGYARELQALRKKVATYEARDALGWIPAPAHPDDAAVDRFAAAMKAKLASARAKGRSGWDSPDLCSSEKLARMLVRRGVAGGDVVDVANFAMMLHQRAAQGIETTPDHSRSPMKTALNEYVEADGYWNGWFARLDLLRREVLLALEEMGCCNYNSAAERLRHAHDESGAQLPTLMGLDAAKAKGGA